MQDDSPPDSADPTDGTINRVVTVAECRQFVEFLGLNRATSERCSALFMFELYCRAIVPQLPGDPAKIIAEVRGLEGLGRLVGTKAAEQFERPPLQGLWKKHYFVGGMASMRENIRLGWGRKQHGLLQILRENYNPTTARLPPQVISRRIADAAVTNTYAERSREQRLTGEWIIFAKYEDENYYLCLARHDEDGGDILERIKRGCADEFPFLRFQLRFL
jgi:hypothetical protein